VLLRVHARVKPEHVASDPLPAPVVPTAAEERHRSGPGPSHVELRRGGDHSGPGRGGGSDDGTAVSTATAPLVTATVDDRRGGDHGRDGGGTDGGSSDESSGDGGH
jgi:hypothetical protein